MGNVNTVVDFTQHSLELGQLAHPVSAPTLIGLCVLGNIIKDVVNTGQADPNTALIIALGNKMDKMSQRMDDNYRDLKQLIVHNEFTRNIVIETEVLDRLMRNVLKYRNRAARQEFVDQYNKMNPHGLAIRLLQRLKHQSTDPVYAAMDADALWSRATYNTWQRSLHNLLGTLMISHAFHAGLHGNTISSPDPLDEVIKEIMHEFSRFLDKYDGGYWPHRVQQLMERTADGNRHLWNDGKAVILRDALNSIYTRSEFYIVVYDECSGYGRHAFTGGDYVHQFRRAGCNMVIARSHAIKGASHSQRARLQAQVEEWRGHHINRNYKAGFLPCTSRVKNHVENSGFVGIITDECNPQIRSAGHHEWGPGWWITADVNHRYDHHSPPAVYGYSSAKLIVGFR